MKPDTIQRICEIAAAARRRWGNGSSFQIITRLTEELGEIASEVNHLESQGIKREKRSEVDPGKLAKEVYDLLRGVSDLVDAYDLADTLDAQVAESHRKWVEAGYIQDQEGKRADRAPTIPVRGEEDDVES